MDERTKFREALHIAFAVQPKVEIAAFGIFFVEMLETALVEGIEIGIGKQFKTIGHRAMHDGKRIDLSIGLGDDGAVEGSRRVLTAGTMIFHGIAHGEELVLREPLLQGIICH